MSYNAVIKSDDPNAIDMLKGNIEVAQGRIDYMQTVNDYYKENDTVIGCPGVDYESALKLDERVSDTHPTPYPGKFFSDNFADIRRLQSNIERLENNPESIFKGWQFEGGEAVINLANNRLQLMFDERPGARKIFVIKKNGFKWAPTQKAWQRKLEPRSFEAADKIDFIKPKNGMKPSELQPKAPKKDAPER